MVIITKLLYFARHVYYGRPYLDLLEISWFWMAINYNWLAKMKTKIKKMRKSNLCKWVTVLMVVVLGLVIFFVLPSDVFYCSSSNANPDLSKAFLAFAFGAALSSAIISINPKGFFNLVESGIIIGAMLIIAVVIAAIIS